MLDYQAVAEAFEDRAEGEVLFLNIKTGEMLRYFDGIEAKPDLKDPAFFQIPSNLVDKNTMMAQYALAIEDDHLSSKLLKDLKEGGEKRFLDILRVHSLSIPFYRYMHDEIVEALKIWVAGIES